jgi:peptidoglycan-associated lipoprotein
MENKKHPFKMEFLNSVITLVLIAFFTTGFAQQKNFYKEADLQFESHAYYEAIDLYKAAYKKASNKIKPECLWKTAECYRIINDVKQAEIYYQKAIKAACEQKTLAQLYLADMMKMQEKYAEAKSEYEKYAAEVPSDKRGSDGVQSCQLAQKWKDKPTRFKVENMAQINSSEWDYAPMYAERKKYSTLLFTSTRQGATGDMDNNVGQLFSDIFMTRVDKNGKWSTPTPLPSPINTKVNEAVCALDEKGAEMYFTRCGVSKGKHPKCQLYFTTKRGQSWDEPALLPFCKDSFIYGHPTLSKDGKVMIFSSDLEDSISSGKGGLDLYYVTLDESTKKWSKNPINLGPEINTPGDEIFPFLHYDGTLYFSSNGHLGMGGTDIFKAAASKKNSWTKPQNMFYPINSSGDDYGIVFESENERGYLSSTRAGGKGGDDIYSFVLPPLLHILEGYVTEELTKLPVPGATIKLVGSDNSSTEFKTDEKGYYKFEWKGQERYINANTSYVVSASALDVKTTEFPDGLLGTPKGKITTVGLKESTSFRQDFILTKIVRDMHMPMILFDLGKSDLGHSSNPKDSLEFLVKVMSESQNITVELSAHTDYRSDAKFNQTLSFNRAKTCVDYLIGTKGIDPNRIQPAGYGESRPAITDRNFTTPSGKSIKTGTTLSQTWIDKNFPQKKNKADYEFVMQINRRVVFTILRKDYVPKNNTEGQPVVAPEIKLTNSQSEGGEGDNSTEWDNVPVPQQEQPKTDGTQIKPVKPAEEVPQEKPKY